VFRYDEFRGNPRARERERESGVAPRRIREESQRRKFVRSDTEIETQTRALRVKVPCGGTKGASGSAQRQLGLSPELEDRPWRSTRAALFSSVLCRPCKIAALIITRLLHKLLAREGGRGRTKWTRRAIITRVSRRGGTLDLDPGAARI